MGGYAYAQELNQGSNQVSVDAGNSANSGYEMAVPAGGGHGGGGHGSGGHGPGHHEGGKWHPHPGWRAGWHHNAHWYPRWYRTGIRWPLWVWVGDYMPSGYWQCTAFNEQLRGFSAIGPNRDEAAYGALYNCGGASYEAAGCYIPENYCRFRP